MTKPQILLDIENITSQLADIMQFKISTVNGLNITINAGRLKLTDGTWWEFNGGTANLIDNYTNEIMINLKNKVIHCFQRSIHSGAVHIATVTTLNGIVTKIEYPEIIQLPRTSIARTKNKLSYGSPTVKGILIGDSLTEGAGSGTYWTELNFNIANNAIGYNVPNVENVLIDNVAIGSQTSHYGLAVIGEAINTNQGKYGNTAIKYKEKYTTQFLTNEVNKSKVLKGVYDFAIVSFGMNGGTYNLECIELIIRKLKKQGIDVMILTQNNKTTDVNAMYDDGFSLKKLADVYSCDLIDTWCFVREKELRGITVHYDTTHLVQEGHNAYADAVRSVLNTIQIPIINTNNISDVRVFNSYKNASTKFFNSAEIQFTPFETNGAVTGGTNSNSNKNIAIMFGGKTVDNYITELQVGQYAYFCHPSAHAVDILTEWNSPFTADIQHMSSLAVLSSVSMQFNVQRIGLTEGVALSTYGDLATGKPGYSNRGIRIECKTGIMKLVGVVFYTYENEEINFDSIKFNGAWSNDTWLYNHSYAKFTDTINDNLIIEFEGKGCQLLLSNRTASGIIDVYLDGKKIYADLDLYSTGSFNYNLNIFPNSSDNVFEKGIGKHIVKIVLKGQNASAIAPVSTNRRLMLLNGYVFK